MQTMWNLSKNVWYVWNSMSKNVYNWANMGLTLQSWVEKTVYRVETE